MRVLLVLLVATAVGGCGDPEIKRRNAVIEDAIRGYYRAVGAGDGQAACAAMTGDARADIARRARGAGVSECAEVFERGASYFEGITVEDVDRLKVEGDTATAVVRFGRLFEVQKVRLERVGGRWQVASAEDD